MNLRRRVEELLLAHEAKSGLLPAGASLSAPDPDGEPGDPQTISMGGPITEMPGILIDRYKLLEKLGEGGFGAIWAAEQREPVRRRVALKIIKLGVDTKQVVARFEAERLFEGLMSGWMIPFWCACWIAWQTFMDHPNIAKVLDAGTTETSRPYFVIELVRGIPITKYCDQETPHGFRPAPEKSPRCAASNKKWSSSKRSSGKILHCRDRQVSPSETTK